MAVRTTGWTRDQLLIALRLYMRTPFGRLHGRNPEIIALAGKISRTANALAMKACNFASLDPHFRQTNRKGLTGASEADRQIWAEFGSNPEELAAQAEEAFARLEPERSVRNSAAIAIPEGDTDVVRLVRTRRVQSFFRAAVMTSYDGQCAISGLAIPELLVASHIIPWNASIARRADPTNGLCLNALYDRAFDRGLITIDDQMRVVVSSRMHDGVRTAELTCSLDQIAGRGIRLPRRFVPDDTALAHHRQHVFVD